MDTNYNTILENKSLSFLTRVAIMVGLKNNDSVTTIAKELGFSRQSIHKEINRGTMIRRNSDWTESKIYDPYKAEYAYKASLANRGRLSKIDDEFYYDFIRECLKNKLSPEVIAYKIDNDPNFKSKVCFKTIYNWIYKGELDVLYTDVLLYPKKHCKPHKKEKNYIKPNGGQSIEERPENSEERVEFGHWEIDCVVGKRAGESACLMTIVERKTRYGIVVKIAKKSKKCIVKALKKIKAKFGKYFYDIFKSITCDNGSEFKDAEGMSLKLKSGKKVSIYYAHAYSSWERGTNENFNKMIRRWFKKGTNFLNMTQQMIDKVVEYINSYPRKQFGFKTANELFSIEYQKVIENKNK